MLCIRNLAYFDSHTVFIKVCDTPHKTEFRLKKPPKVVPLKLEIYLNYAFSLDLCCYNIVWTPNCFNGVCMYGLTRKLKFLCEKPASFYHFNLWKLAVFICCYECLVLRLRNSVKLVHNCPGSLQNSSKYFIDIHQTCRYGQRYINNHQKRNKK